MILTRLASSLSHQHASTARILEEPVAVHTPNPIQSYLTYPNHAESAIASAFCIGSKTSRADSHDISSTFPNLPTISNNTAAISEYAEAYSFSIFGSPKHSLR
ncbi:hypothetical protein CERZMDRAFT_91449 [Cercospora zeae-maydis SCOH1-5]|uniref:Uncharacterized protein n=1 Tax=Cercospora zeae-maydis SCOH1-5 TaxID=717836 RepID=A0A6A6F575_9PEZI|nr:hypothetical protein CERZMDRAFT_91449 [Cercospora zeae-maydis SCOH1-5]